MNVLPSPYLVFNAVWDMLEQSTLWRSRRITTIRKRSPRDFDIDPNTGCFPPEPLPRLPQEFDCWEKALASARDALSLGEDTRPAAIAKRHSGEQWRESIRAWQVIDTATLRQNVRLLQRAHMVLANVLHFYANSIPPTEEKTPLRIPKGLAIPLVEVSQELGIAPVLTFADTVLWNYTLRNPDLPLSTDNFQCVYLFSGTEAEANFYKTSAAVELKGVEMLQIFTDFMNLPSDLDFTTISKLSRDLTRLAKIVDELTDIFETMRASVDPAIFYWEVRPWYKGENTTDPSRPGWVYEGVPKSALTYTAGPSAGQSTVMHALDVFLDVDHKLQKRRYPAPSEGNKRADQGFMERMRQYMPGKHRDYLVWLEGAPRSMREVARRTPSLREPYNTAILSLKKWRDIHIRIVTRYIITPASADPPAEYEGTFVRSGPSRGTGGMEVSNQLKAGRDATKRTELR